MSKKELLAIMAAIIASGTEAGDLGNVFLDPPTDDAVHFVKCAEDILSAVLAALRRAEGAA